MAVLTVVYDACVLYPAPLRDLLMHLALADLYRARWTNEIHEEWIRNVLKKRKDLTRGQLERTRELMNQNVLDCLVRGYEPLIKGLELPDADDRHVLAAAIRAGADIIVTFNLKHFPDSRHLPLRIKAQHPDQFVSGLLDAYPIQVCAAANRQRTTLKNPAMTAPEFLNKLSRQHLTQSVKRLRELQELI